MRKLLLTLAMLLAMGASVWADNVVLQPQEATYINAGNGDTNYSEAGVLYANFSKVSGGVLTDQLSAYGGSDITIVKFDASSLPSGCTITAASLTFTSQCTVSGKNSQLAIVPIGTNWTASKATWNNLDKGADGSKVTNLAYSNNTASTQTYDAKSVINNDEDKIVAFAVFTNTGRQQKVSNFNLSITYTQQALVEHSYSIVAKAGDVELKTLATGKAYENAEYSVTALPAAIVKEGVCYKLNDTDVIGYAKSFTMGAADATAVVSYSEADFNYFFEAESILSKSYGNANGSYSSGVTAGVYTGANLYMPSIAAGIYTVKVNTSVRRSNEDIFTVQTSTDGTNWTDAGSITLTSNKAGDYSLEGVVINGYVRLVEAKSQNMCHYVDYVTLTKTGDASYTRSTTTGKFGTICLPFAPTVVGADLYSATINPEGDAVTLEPVETPIAGTPYIYKATADAQSFAYTTGELVSAPVSAAPLVGVFEATEVPVGSFVMQTQEGIQAFYQVAEGQQPTLSAYKAYLTVPASNNAKMITIGEDTDATAIKAIDALTTGNAKIYDLNGRELKSLQKGVNIVNGVKVYVK